MKIKNVSWWTLGFAIAVAIVPRHSQAEDWTTGGNDVTQGTEYLGSTNAAYVEFRADEVHALRLVPTAGTPQVIGGYSGNTASTYVGATIGGGGTYLYVNSVSGDYGTVGGGRANGTAAYGVVGGGYNNAADASYAAVGGGYFNDVENSYSFIGGGYSNLVTNTYATICGGDDNAASASYASIGGGSSNQVSVNAGTIAGGNNNTVSTYSGGAIGGGAYNTASGSYSVVAGGYHNEASGSYAAVAGGTYCAAASYSFAAGRRAKADDTGCFMWGDSTDADVACPGSNTFNARAAGFWFGSTSSPAHTAGHLIDTSAGAYLTTGGAWTDYSDPAGKHEIVAVEPSEVLATLRDLPLSQWSYVADPPGVRHLGPMADDFHTLFGLGEGNGIAALDSAGVALASVQALDRMIQDRFAHLSRLEARLAQLERARPSGSARNAALPWLIGAILVGAGLAAPALRRRRGGGRS